MEKYRIFICFICIVFAYSCVGKQKEKTFSTNEGMGINLDKNDEVSLYDMFSKIDLIPLETNKESLLNNPITKMIISNDQYYILDRKQGVVIIFDSLGRFVKKIDKQGQGPGEYTLLCDFNINRFNGNLELLSANGKINVYDSLGINYINGFKLPEKELSVNYIMNFTPDIYVFFANNREKYKMFFYSKEKQEIISETYDFSRFILTKTLFHHAGSPFYVYNDSVFFVQAYNGNVFNLTTGFNLSLRYQWDFGKCNFDISQVPLNEPIEYYLKYARQINNQYAFNFLLNGENQKYFITRFRYKNIYKHLILNKKTGKHLLFDTFKEGGQCLPFIVTEKAMYTCLFPEQIHYVVNKNLFNDENSKFETIKESDNPVLIKFTFK